jgi:tetratricopeptide (TPR) repeat protein
MNGLLSEGALPGVLREVYVGRRSGRLHCSRDDQRYSVRFVKGDIVHCESSVPHAHLGQIMVSLGMLDEATRARAAAVVDQTGRRLGEVLLEMGAIDQGRLQDALAAQVREHLLRVFTWTDGACAFQDHEPPSEPATLKLSTGQMIMEAVRLTRHPEAIRSGLGDLGRVVILSPDPLLRFQRITLTPADGFVLSRVDGAMTAGELLQLVPLPPEESERSLFGLLCTGLIDFLPVVKDLPPPSSAQRRAEILAAFEQLAQHDHFEVLGVSRDASQAEVAAAYASGARRFHPDVHHEPGLSDLRERLDAIFERLSGAHEALRRPASRQQYVASLSRVAPADVPAPGPPAEPTADPEQEARKAEEAFAMADACAKEGRQWEAIGVLAALVTVTSGRNRRRARLQLAELYAKNPRTAKSAEEQLTAVIEENPSNVEARLRLARLFHDRQMPARAAEYLRQALELEPKHRGALEMMASMEGAPKGVLGRIFGR